MCPRILSDRHDQTETDRALWFVSTGPQRTNSSLQTGLRSIGCLVLEKLRYFRQGIIIPPPVLTTVNIVLVLADLAQVVALQ